MTGVIIICKALSSVLHTGKALYKNQLLLLLLSHRLRYPHFGKWSVIGNFGQPSIMAGALTLALISLSLHHNHGLWIFFWGGEEWEYA